MQRHHTPQHYSTATYCLYLASRGVKRDPWYGGMLYMQWVANKTPTLPTPQWSELQRLRSGVGSDPYFWGCVTKNYISSSESGRVLTRGKKEIGGGLFLFHQCGTNGFLSGCGPKLKKLVGIAKGKISLSDSLLYCTNSAVQIVKTRYHLKKTRTDMCYLACSNPRDGESPSE